MAQIANISNSMFDKILPVYGKPSINFPVWNEGQKMFITSEYESSSGNRYYKGVRFCDQLAIVETWGTYHTWTYINSVEIYSFDGNKPKLAGKRTFDKQFYDQYFIKSETEKMVQEFIQGQFKIQNLNMSMACIEDQAKVLVDKSYKSFLDEDYNPRVEIMLPVLTANQ